MSARYPTKALKSVFLLGVAFMFMLQAIPGLALGGGDGVGLFARLNLPPDHLLLVFLAVVAILLPRGKPRSGMLLGHTWIALVVVLFAWVVFTNLFVRPPAVDSLREIKNKLGPLLLSYFVAKAFLKTEKDIDRLLLAVLFGTTVLILSQLVHADIHSDLVRQLDQTVLTYTWLGVISGVGVLISVHYFLRGAFAVKLPCLLAVPVCLTGLLMSGNRMTFYFLVLAPVILACTKRLSKHFILAAMLVLLLFFVFIACFPGVVLDALPEVSIRDVAGAQRFLPGKESLLFNLRARPEWWDRALYDRSFTGFLFGVDFGTGIERLHYPAHPHNVFVWMQMLGGVVANLLFAMATLAAWYCALLVYKQAPRRRTRLLAQLNLLAHALVFFVLLSNSWFGAVPILLGFLAAVTSQLFAVRTEEMGPDRRGESVSA